MDLDRCLDLLKDAKSDNEKMAALLLVAKMVRSGDIGEEGRRRVFEAVGFSFINRLLATRQLPEGCSVNTYRKIAVTMLACFCTDPELALHPQVTSKIPVFNEGILQSSPEDPGLAEDSLQCLQALSSSPSGLQQLVGWGTPEALASCFLRRGGVSKQACDLLLSVLGRREVVAENVGKVESAVTVLAEEFRANQDALKFELCEVLYSVLSVAGEVLQAGELVWLRSIATGLKEILSNKIGVSQRNAALQLSALLCHLFGVEWVVSTEEDDKSRPGTFFKLLIHLVGVEVQMLLSEVELSVVLRNSALLSSCFLILEQGVVYLAGLSEQMEQDKGTLPLSQEDLLQLHSVLTNALTFVIQFLQCLESHQDHTLLHHPLVGAAVRVLGAWLSEESLALSEEVYKLLPFLLRLCGSSLSERPAPQTGELDSDGVASCVEMDSSQEVDLLKFLLPGLCHLTAEDKPRAILLKANIQKTLSQRFQDLCSEWSSAEAQGQLALCCGVVMNVCVCEPAAVKEDAAFTAVGGCLVRLLSEGSVMDENTSLALNAALLLLMISRRQGPDRIASHSGVVLAPVWSKVLQLLLETVRACPYLARGTSRLGDASQQWNQHSELWALAMQELTALASAWDDVRLAVANTSHCVTAFNEILSATTGQKEIEHVEAVQSIVGAVCSLLQAILQQSSSSPT